MTAAATMTTTTTTLTLLLLFSILINVGQVYCLYYASVLRHELKIVNVFLYGDVPIDVEHGSEDVFGL